jgi:exopolyphosphatase/guanosine-5'-triphosphate,3'-diphosphate pyrophosphatase
LACDLSGRSPSLLARSTLSLDKSHLILAAEPGFANLLLGEQTNKRANTAAQHLGLKTKIIAA